LTTATITAGPAEDTALADAIILEAMLAEWTDGDNAHAKLLAFELKMIIFFDTDTDTTVYRRPNPKARAMRRSGRFYKVRKDHGTTARRKEIDAENAGRGSHTKNSNSQQRKLAKLEARKGNERAIAKLIRLGDLLIGD
jgi:hypothetical protein